jgi:Sec-independent protein translocase protein TatA
MFDVSFSEFIAIIIVLALFINPKKIPEISNSIGKAMSKVHNLLFNIKEEVFREETFKNLKKIQKEIQSQNKNEK